MSGEIDPKRERLTVYLSRDLATRLRVRAAEDRREMSEILSDALTLWLLQGQLGALEAESREPSSRMAERDPNKART